MPTQVGFEAPARFILRSWGEVTADDVLGAYDTILTDPRLGPGTTTLGLSLEVTSAPDAIDLQSLAAALVQLKHKGVVAMANVTAPGAIYGAAKIFSVFAAKHSVRVEVFTDEAEARRYLDASAPGATTVSSRGSAGTTA